MVINRYRNPWKIYLLEGMKFFKLSSRIIVFRMLWPRTANLGFILEFNFSPRRKWQNFPFLSSKIERARLLFKVGHEARAKTVENIWIITESLNILYRENWTRLAAQEIARFQDQLVKRITEDMIATQNGGTYVASSDPVTERRLPEYEWNFAKAFLYSLTVLTTIGECSNRPTSY